MGWLVALVILGLLLLCLCLALLVYYHAQVDDLRAVIRAQRRCMDQMKTEPLRPDRKGNDSERLRDRLGRYPIDPSAN
jgi:hypothetical protein